MIKKLFVAILLLTSSSMFANDYDWERMQWNNILELYPNSYYINTVNIPNRVLRPSFGEFLKVDVKGCGDVSYSGIAAFEWDRFNRILPIDIVRRDSDYERNSQTHYYVIKHGPATAQFIGLEMRLSSLRNCHVIIYAAR